MILQQQIPAALTEFTHALILTGNIRDDMVALLTFHGHAKTVGHSVQVAAEAKRLARRWSLDAGAAEVAGWLHDISAIVPPAERIALAEALQLDILPEERIAPMIIHQKLSASIAQQIFGIEDQAILSAIGCHTTLKANATPLDLAVFAADKIRWDQAGEPPYLKTILAAAERSLADAAFCYIDYLWQRRETLLVVHPWLAEAHADLIGGSDL
jgi:predicted HD superfamily hydrolase involved in NAD metabolism